MPRALIILQYMVSPNPEHGILRQAKAMTLISTSRPNLWCLAVWVLQMASHLVGMYIIPTLPPVSLIDLILIGCTAQLHIHKNQTKNPVLPMKAQYPNQLLRLLGWKLLMQKNMPKSWAWKEFHRRLLYYLPKTCSPKLVIWAVPHLTSRKPG